MPFYVSSCVIFLNLLGRSWLIKLYRCQNSIIYIICNILYHRILNCVFTSQSQISLSPYIWPPLPFTTSPSSLPSDNHYTAVCVCEFLFAFLVSSCVAFSFISHLWVKLYGFLLFLYDIICLAWYSQDPSCPKWQYFIFSYDWVVFHWAYVPHLYPTIY